MNEQTRALNQPAHDQEQRLRFGMKTVALPMNVSKAELITLREWLATWGDGPNWSDPTGSSIPVQKEQLRRLLDHIDWLDEQVEGLIEQGSEIAEAARAIFDAADSFFNAPVGLGLKQAIKRLWTLLPESR